MQFTKRLRPGIRSGEITCTIRIWTSPRVKVGGRYKLEGGEVVVDRMSRIHPGGLFMQALYGGGYVQPNVFDSQAIEDEVRASAARLGGNQPVDNSIPGESATWREGYERSKRGEAITFPYHDVKVTDPAKLARMTDAYQAYRRGELDRSNLPDIRDVLPDDPQRLAEMGILTEPGLSGEDVLLMVGVASTAAGRTGNRERPAATPSADRPAQPCEVLLWPSDVCAGRCRRHDLPVIRLRDDRRARQLEVAGIEASGTTHCQRL